MSTRSYIGYFDPIENSGKVVYCHSDGYPEWTGKKLNQHYTNSQKIIALVALGSLSILGDEIGRAVDWQRRYEDDAYYEETRGQTIAYNRDRGDKLEIYEFKATSFKDFQKKVAESLSGDIHIEFVYLTETYAGSNEPASWVVWDRLSDIPQYELIERQLEGFATALAAENN